MHDVCSGMSVPGKIDDVAVGYELLTDAHTAEGARVRLACRRNDGRRVRIKVTRRDFPRPEELAQLRHELSLLQRLDATPVARALELVSVGNGLGLVLEDAGEQSFDRIFANGATSLELWLRLAIGAAEALEAVHACGVLHKDIKPQHFFFTDEQQVVLIDFSIASTIGHEEQRPEAFAALEGTLAYISPEQTGRMNRSVDRRSDLYSLGVTLYQTLTGALPFAATDPLELVHCHIARFPAPPRSLDPSIPQVVSDIVLRLMAKVAEERYQTAEGVRADLARCLEQLCEHGSLRPFPLGQGDHHGNLRVPQKLYGREAALAALQSRFESAQRGATELVLITGASGIGKSALVHELYKELVRGGQFIGGKFDQFNRSVPYAALAQACAELVQAQLAAPPAELAAWTERVREALGCNARVVSDIVPTLAVVLGQPPELPVLGPAESQNRFEHTFQRFLAASAAPGRTLVLFLDDLQWADAASLRLLKLVLNNPEQRSLLCIGNYRDREVDAVHPLMQLIADVSARKPLTRLQLEPLAEAHVSELLSDTLTRRTGELATLAALITRKTGGNPFFLGQFLHEIARQGLLSFDPVARHWGWDATAIEAARVTDNVVDLVVEKLARLEPRTQAVLKFAAAIGHRFDSQELGVVSGESPREVAASLWQAVEQGFVVPLDKSYRLLPHQTEAEQGEALRVGYRFTHDRVQQAAYAMIPAAERGALHLSVGRHWLAMSSEGPQLEERLFEIVGHLNLGREQLSDGAERLSLARFNLRAAARAKAAAAHANALELAGVCRALLGSQPWQEQPDLCYGAQLITAECRYLSGSVEPAFQAIAELEQNARNLLERVPARNLRSLLLTNQGRLIEASSESVATLRLLGVTMPDPADKAELGQSIGQKFGAFQGALAGRSIESFADIPAMTDPEKLALASSFALAIPAAFQSNSELMVLMTLNAVQLPLQYGTSPVSSFFYELYGIVHIVVTGDYATSYRFGQLGIALAQRPEHAAARGAVHFIYAGFLCHWSRPLADCVEHFRLGMRAGYDAGDALHAHYCIGIGAAYRIYAGEALGQITDDMSGYMDVLRAANDVVNVAFLEVSRQTVACLEGRTSAFGLMDLEGFSEPMFEASAPPPVLAMYGAHKAMLRYLAGLADETLEACERFQPLPALFYNADYKLYRALALAQLARRAPLEQRAELIGRMQADVQAHAGWASGCPENFAHRLSLLEAEVAALEGNGAAAMDAYERAIAQATAHGFSQYVALANELCGRFHLAAGRRKVARSYLQDACYHYERWGASGKAARLLEQFNELEIAPTVQEPMHSARHVAARTRTRTVGATVVGDGGLDLLSAMRAAQAIASELELSRLIEQLLRILVENAGARRACLILPQGEQLVVSAAMTVDPDRVELGLAEPLAESSRLPISVVQYVARSKEPVVLDAASEDKRFALDRFLSSQAIKSVAALPLLHQGELSALLYLENAAVAGVFHAARVERLQFLASHAAVAIENAKLYGQVQAARRSLEDANSNLEQKVRARTAALSRRNADLRRVLDTVSQGLITLDLQGRISVERSAAADRWFGPFGVEEPFAAHMRRFDERFGDWFEVAFQTLLDGHLTAELAIAQLPARLRHGGREYCCSYSAIRTGDELSGVLVAVSDETDAVNFAREELAQKELLALCRRVGRDRSSVLGFFEEGSELLAQLSAQQEDRDFLERALHTLKGNAGLQDLSLLAERCHAAEDALAEQGDVARALGAIQERWIVLSDTLDQLLGRNRRENLEVPRAELRRMIEEADAGCSVVELGEQLRRLQLEPLERPLLRLGRHALGLSQRLGRGGVQLEVEGGGVLADPEQGRSFWLALVHIIRNAVDHGFEGAELRSSAGKPADNQLRLAASWQAERVVVCISDDGRGIDWARVQQLAAQRGLPSATRAELAAALLAPELTTRTEVTSTSGRGVGLAAVDREIRALDGTLAVESETGSGCTWIITVPAARLGAIAGQPTSGRRPRHSNPPPRAAAS